MSKPLRAPATANPDCAGKLAEGPGGHNLIGTIGTGTATGACSGLANGVNGDQVSVPAGLLPLASKDQCGDSRNATTRGSCDIGAYDTGGAS